MPFTSSMLKNSYTTSCKFECFILRYSSILNSQSLIDILYPLVDILNRRILDHCDRYSRSTIAFAINNRVLDHSDRHSQSPIVKLGHSDRRSPSSINNLNHSDRVLNHQSLGHTTFEWSNADNMSEISWPWNMKPKNLHASKVARYICPIEITQYITCTKYL